jgi:hypothetical protein
LYCYIFGCLGRVSGIAHFLFVKQKNQDAHKIFDSYVKTNSSFLLTIIVEKSKMCLDFSVTYFIIHLVISSFYYRVPATADWWIVHVVATIVMVLVGEYLCSLRELSDIPLLPL